jgi:DNA-binding NarL/FixJ family response regulator
VQNGSGCSFPPRFQQADQLSKLKVLLADDHPILLEKVASLLEPTFEVVGRVRDGQSLFDAAMNLQPDLIVSDISMPILNGIEAASKLKDSGCRSKVVFLTVHTDPDYVLRCFVTGALGYVVKRHMATDLLPAIREAMAGRNYTSPNFHQQN